MQARTAFSVNIEVACLLELCNAQVIYIKSAVCDTLQHLMLLSHIYVCKSVDVNRGSDDPMCTK